MSVSVSAAMDALHDVLHRMSEKKATACGALQWGAGAAERSPSSPCCWAAIQSVKELLERPPAGAVSRRSLLRCIGALSPDSRSCSIDLLHAPHAPHMLEAAGGVCVRAPVDGQSGRRCDRWCYKHVPGIINSSVM
jgi:hypothetical protein